MAKKTHVINKGKKQIIVGLMEEHNVKTTDDIQDSLADLLNGRINYIMKAEKEDDLNNERYEQYELSDSSTGCNSYKAMHSQNEYEETVYSSCLL